MISHSLHTLKVIFAVISIILGVTAPAKILAQQNDQVNLFKSAQNFENAGEFDKAKTIYKKLLNLQPWNIQYLTSLNTVYLKQKKYDASISLLENQVSKFPNDLNAYGLLGSTYYIINNEKKAFEIWDKAVDLNPSSIVNYKVISNYALENRAFDKAIDILRRGKTVSKDPAQFSYDLASLFSITMKFSEAASEYCDVLLTKPLQAGLIKQRMSQYLDNHGAVEQSIAVVKTYAEEHDDTNVFLDLLIFLYTQKGDYKEAYGIVIDLDLKVKNHGVTIYNFAQDAFSEGEYKIASEAYRKLIQLYPESQFKASADLGYVKSIESIAGENFLAKNSTWKPYYSNDTAGTGEYNNIIDAYKKLYDENLNSSIRIESLYREALILKDKFNAYDSSAVLFNKLIAGYKQTSYTYSALEQLALISIMQGDLISAERECKNIIAGKNAPPDIVSRSELLLAKISFWKGDFKSSSDALDNISKNSADEEANDAMQLSLLLTSSRNDSLNLVKFSEAELYREQNNYKQAAELFKSVLNDTKILPLKDFAKFRYAEMLIAGNEFPVAAEILNELGNSTLIGVYTDKSLFLLGKLYQFGIKDLEKAKVVYTKLLESFPNSLQYDETREILNKISNNISESI